MDSIFPLLVCIRENLLPASLLNLKGGTNRWHEEEEEEEEEKRTGGRGAGRVRGVSGEGPGHGLLWRERSLLDGTEAADLSGSSDPEREQDSGSRRSDCECGHGDWQDNPEHDPL